MRTSPEKHSVNIILGMGTNKGDRLGNLTAAVQSLAPQVMVRRVSSVYSTPPWGYTDQPDFLNIVLIARTSLSPEGLLTLPQGPGAAGGAHSQFPLGAAGDRY